MKEFPPNHNWYNSLPLKFEEELVGKIVILDFWTYCCINCLHTLPDLEILQNWYIDEPTVVFIGVHSGKFRNEKDSWKVREAVLRYDVKNAVINDNKMVVWKNFECSSWPSLVIVGPHGFPLLFLKGEGQQERLEWIDAFIWETYWFYFENLDWEPLHLLLECDAET